MKLILTQEVTGLGGPGDVVEVKNGYGRNYLVPRGLAMLWTKGGEKQVEAIRKARATREIRDADRAREIKAELEDLQVRLSARTGNAGRLFGSVTPAEIATAVQQAGGPSIDKRRVEIPQPIKTVGSHQVSVRLHAEVQAKVNVEVQPA